MLTGRLGSEHATLGQGLMLGGPTAGIEIHGFIDARLGWIAVGINKQFEVNAGALPQGTHEVGSP